MKTITEKHVTEVARRAADETEPRKRGGPWSWTDAMKRAPWLHSYPAEHETTFRRAYAQRLVERRLALPIGRSRNRGSSGKTKLIRHTVNLSPEESASTLAQAEAAGVSWSTWARRKLVGQ